MVVVMIVMGMGMSTAAAASFRVSAATSPFSGSHLANENHLKADLLESKLVTSPTKESQGTLGGFVNGAQLDTDRLPLQVREVLLHLAVENERDVGIELLLKLPELALPVLPGTRLEHRQHEDVLARVMGEGVEHPGTLDARAGRGRITPCQIFAEGNHT